MSSGLRSVAGGTGSGNGRVQSRSVAREWGREPAVCAPWRCVGAPLGTWARTGMLDRAGRTTPSIDPVDLGRRRGPSAEDAVTVDGTPGPAGPHLLTSAPSTPPPTPPPPAPCRPDVRPAVMRDVFASRPRPPMAVMVRTEDASHAGGGEPSEVATDGRPAATFDARTGPRAPGQPR